MPIGYQPPYYGGYDENGNYDGSSPYDSSGAYVGMPQQRQQIAPPPGQNNQAAAAPAVDRNSATTGGLLSGLLPLTGAGNTYASMEGSQAIASAYSNATNISYQEWLQQQQNMQPWLQSGGGALNQLNYLMGITPNSSLGTNVSAATPQSITGTGGGSIDANGNYIPANVGPNGVSATGPGPQTSIDVNGNTYIANNGSTNWPGVISSNGVPVGWDGTSGSGSAIIGMALRPDANGNMPSRPNVMPSNVSALSAHGQTVAPPLNMTPTNVSANGQTVAPPLNMTPTPPPSNAGFGSLMQSYQGVSPTYGVQNENLGQLNMPSLANYQTGMANTSVYSRQAMPQNITAGAMPDANSYGPGALPQNIANSYYDNMSNFNITQDPSYQFNLQQQNLALQQSAAAKGGYFSGQTGVDLANQTSGLASQEYANAYARQMNLDTANLGLAQQQFQNAYNLQGTNYSQQQQQYNNLMNQQQTGFGQNQQIYQNALGAQAQDFTQGQQLNDTLYNRNNTQNQDVYNAGMAQAGANYAAGAAQGQANYQSQMDTYNAQTAAYLQQYNMYNQNQQNQYNMLAGLSGTGQVAAGQLAAGGQNYAQQAGQNGVGGATAQAAGMMGAATGAGTAGAQISDWIGAYLGGMSGSGGS